MPIPVERELEVGLPFERCCFCRGRTPFWTKLDTRKPGEQVACCEGCANHASHEDVPAKAVWCRRERIAEANRPVMPRIEVGQ